MIQRANQDMEVKKWFILNEGRVSGPFQKAEVEFQMAQVKSALVWGRGLQEWLNFDKWGRAARDLEAQSSAQKASSERLWKLRVAGQEMKPMTHEQMINFLKTKTDYSQIQIWTDGYSEWKEIYQIHKIMDELGVSRRSHPRVPIMGSVTCEGGSHGNYESRLLTISEGGLGMTDGQPARIGEKFKVIIKSPNLYTPIHATGEVVYVSSDAYVGLKFLSIHSESKSAIIEYVKKFIETNQQA